MPRTRIFHGSERSPVGARSRRRPLPSAFHRFVHRFVRRARVRARVIDFLIEPVASPPMHPAGRERKREKPRPRVVYVEFRNVAREDRVGPDESSRARSLRALDLFSFLPPRKVSGDITARTAGLASNAFSLTCGIRVSARAVGKNVHTRLAVGIPPIARDERPTDLEVSREDHEKDVM